MKKLEVRAKAMFDAISMGEIDPRCLRAMCIDVCLHIISLIGTEQIRAEALLESFEFRRELARLARAKALREEFAKELSVEPAPGSALAIAKRSSIPL